MSAPDPSRVLVTSDDPRLSDARPPSAHTHPVAEVDGLQAALDGKAATSHTHSMAQVTGLDSALSGKADLVDGKVPADQLPEHSHTTADVSGLDAALAGKAASTHTHTPASIGAVASSGSAVTLWSGTAAQYAALAPATKNAAGFVAVIS